MTGKQVDLTHIKSKPPKQENPTIWNKELIKEHRNVVINKCLFCDEFIIRKTAKKRLFLCLEGFQFPNPFCKIEE